MYWKTISGVMAASLAVAAAIDFSIANDNGTVTTTAPPATTPVNTIAPPASGNATDGNSTVAPVLPSPLPASKCMLEPGVDYVGNDLSNVAGKVEDCCTKCHDTTGCKAYTWSDFNGGTCWLKSAKGETQPNTGVHSGVIGARQEDNTDYVGNDIGNKAGAKAADCHATCKATSGCKAFTWSDFNGGTCWLKSARGETKAVAGVHSAELSEDHKDPVDPKDPKVPEWKIEQGVDYVGSDLEGVAGASAKDCEAKCVSYGPSCTAFTFTDWNGGTCWLKSAKGDTKTQDGVTSGVRSSSSAIIVDPITPGQCAAEKGKDYVGNDIGNSPAGSAADCCTLCSVKAGCAAYTWTSWEGGRCWFKSAVTEVKDNAEAVSGKVAAGKAQTHIAHKLRNHEIPSRSVNLGGWLVAEYWMSMTSPAWEGVGGKEGPAWGGEFTAMDALGKEKGTKQFEEHRKTWITEADIQEIASVGLNMVRVPVGFWIVDDIPGVEPTPISSVYARGALKYLDTLINNWAVKYNVGVYLSLHSHQGSQSGMDHSAPQVLGNSFWSDYRNNVDNSIRFAKIMAARYKDAPAFVGLQLMNEPAGSTSYEVRDKYYLDAYKAIRATGNDCIIGVSPMLFQQDQYVLRDFMRWPEFTNVWMEWHVYYKWGHEKSSEDQIIAAVKTYRNTHFTDWPGNNVLIGEWSLGNGYSEEKFKDVNKLKEFAAAQLDQYKEARAGWAFWSWHHDDEKLPDTISGWSLRQLLRKGIFKVPGY